MTKLAVLYYSATGHGTSMAGRVAAAAQVTRPCPETRNGCYRASGSNHFG